MIQYNSADLEGYNEVERTKMAIQKKLKENLASEKKEKHQDKDNQNFMKKK